jgi:hypothetical protein
MTVEVLPIPDLAEEVVEGRRRLDVDEADWLVLVSDFDRAGLWSIDGYLTAAEWLMDRCRMPRSTAYEKLRVAESMRLRPELAKAMQAGEVSYSQARMLSRVADPGSEIDAIFLELARSGSVRALEHAIRHYELRLEQDLPPGRDRIAEKGAHLQEVAPGMDLLRLTLPKEEMAEFTAVLSAFLDRSAGTGKDLDPKAWRTEWDDRRAEAIQEMARAALAAAGKRATGADRYMAHVVIDVEALFADNPDVASLLDGSPITADAARKMACDSTIVAHLVRNGFEPLALGHKTKTFTDGQKRAIKARDRNRCRIPGCERTQVDCHHIVWASRNGRTDVVNGICVCDRHHTLIHKGALFVDGNADGTLTVKSRDGTLSGFSAPPTALPRI